ncbi:unnamed protein product [Prorocentrum cordatum]|uniref:Potassium channel domain-containing protein n=1 Tax=Prorocentrum cordatum TaxID=2364126 RepID=A0ABN9SGJ9_9DINO|nr:unnamed protein product [Polarella glacialis]
MGTIIMIHLLACFWFALGKGSTRGWIYQERIDNASFGDQYLVSFQWSMARLHPSTFGENMSLETTRERIFSIIVSLFALCGGGVFISSITNTMAQLQAYRQQRTRKLWVIRAYVRENHISTQLSVRVKKYVEKSLGRKLREQHAAELVPDDPRLPIRAPVALEFGPTAATSRSACRVSGESGGVSRGLGVG